MLPEDQDERYELQEGVRLLRPISTPEHQVGVALLLRQITLQLPAGLKGLLQIDVDLQLAPPDQPGTVRIPDIVVVSRSAFDRVRAERGFLRANETLLAVEVLSVGTHRRDTRIKHAEYADAGIGRYWMVDLDDGPSLTACHLGGELGYVDAPPVRGEFVTTDPFPVRIDLTALIDD